MNEDRIIQKLIEMDEKIDGLATQESLDEFRREVTDTLDAHSRMITYLDQERLAGFERMNRIEKDVQQLKSHPNLA